MKPRIILYTGKGGVGKTTVAAATGLTVVKATLSGGVLDVQFSPHKEERRKYA